MKKTNLVFCILCLSFLFFSCKSDKKEETKVEEETTEKVEKVSGHFQVDQGSSIVSWVGSKPVGEHKGQIKIKSGEMHFKEGHLTGGKFIADMSSINVMDLEGAEKNDLESHLKGTIDGKENHFFNVEKYPESQFIIKNVDKVENKYIIYGELTIKDVTNAIEFEAEIYFGNNNEAVKFVSDKFVIDRTKWGIEFMSKSVFDDLKDNFISDDMQLQVSLKANKMD